MGLKVIVIGAGVAGLSMSISLSHAGHEVVIFEKSSFKSEIGAAITVTPNGARVLDRWGFDFSAAGLVEGQYMELVDGTTFQPLHKTPFGHLKAQYGYAMGHYHRVDLHRELRRLAESLGVQILLKSFVTDIDAKGVVTLKNEETAAADLVVIADGSHSQLIPKVTGSPAPLVSWGRSAIRALVSQKNIRANPRLASHFGQSVPGWYVPCTMPPEATMLVTYPCRNNEVLNIALVHNTLPGYEDREDWNSPISLEEAQRPIKNFNPICHEVLSLADDISIHSLTRREILPNFVNGRLLLVGDAAHIMPPSHAQGAVSCIEEACALGVFLENMQDPDEVPDRLRLYEQLVKPRMQTVQLLSLAMPGQNDKFRQQAKVIWEDAGLGPLYPDEPFFYTASMAAFFYTYDIKEEAEQYLRNAGVRSQS